jgi:hypothetical protein
LTKADLLALGETTLRKHPEASPVAEEYFKLIKSFKDSINYSLLHGLIKLHFPVKHHHFECSSWHRNPKLKDHESGSAVSNLAGGVLILRNGTQYSHVDLMEILSASIHLLFYACGEGRLGSSDILKKYTDFIKDIFTGTTLAYGYYQRALFLTQARILIVREVQFDHLKGRQSDPDWRVVLPLLGDEIWKNKDSFWAMG